MPAHDDHTARSTDATDATESALPATWPDGAPVDAVPVEPAATGAPTPGAGPEGQPEMRVRLGQPGDILAAIPHLLGFVPSDSLVLIALTAQDSRARVAAVVRANLPAATDRRRVVEACLRRLGGAQPADVIVVVIGGGALDAAADPPHTEVVSMIETDLAGLGLPVNTRLWAGAIEQGAPWRCYPPCGCSGLVPDPEFSQAAVATAMLGRRTYRSREEAVAAIAPDPGADLPRLRRLIATAADLKARDRDIAEPSSARRYLHRVAVAAQDIERGASLDIRQIADVATALCDRRVRDVAIGWALGDGAVTASAAEALWTTLTRATPAPVVAEPAALLAISVMLRGGGPLVVAALERAAAADPGHTLAALTAALLERGTDPETVRACVRSASSDAVAALGSPAT